MALKASLVTLGAASASKVASALNSSAAVPVSVILWNASNATVYVGGPDVVDSGAHQGLPVAPSTFSPAFDLLPGDDLWAHSTAGGNCNVLVTRQ